MFEARKPRRVSDKAIDLEINHPDFGWIPFLATTYDVEDYGVELYHKAAAGDFGEVEPMPEPTKDELSAELRNERDNLLLELDNLVGNPLRFASFTDGQKSELGEYRQGLLDVPQQADFPYSVDWPSKPTALSKGN